MCDIESQIKQAVSELADKLEEVLKESDIEYEKSYPLILAKVILCCLKMDYFGLLVNEPEMFFFPKRIADKLIDLDSKYEVIRNITKIPYDKDIITKVENNIFKLGYLNSV